MMRDEINLLVSALRNQRQLDRDGTEVAVSREALDKAIEYIARFSAQPLSLMEIPPIQRDEGMDRTYIPIPGGWEIQTKGRGSTFRIADVKADEQIAVIEHRLHEPLTRMAMDARESYCALIARARAVEFELARRDEAARDAVIAAPAPASFCAPAQNDATAPDSRARLEKEVSLHVQLAAANGPKITVSNIVETCLGFALSQRTAPIPAGFVLLPEVPTIEMSVAFAEQWFKKRRAIDDPDDLAECWPYVIAAAPPAPVHLSGTRALSESGLDALAKEYSKKEFPKSDLLSMDRVHYEAGFCVGYRLGRDGRGAYRNAILEEIASGYEGGDLHRGDEIARDIRLLKSGAGKA